MATTTALSQQWHVVELHYPNFDCVNTLATKEATIVAALLFTMNRLCVIFTQRRGRNWLLEITNIYDGVPGEMTTAGPMQPIHCDVFRILKHFADTDRHISPTDLLTHLPPTMDTLLVLNDMFDAGFTVLSDHHATNLPFRYFPYSYCRAHPDPAYVPEDED